MSTSTQSTAGPETTADPKTLLLEDQKPTDSKTLLLEDQKPTEYREVDKNKIDTIDNLITFLETKNISIENWGKDDAKSVNDLLKEIKENETILLEKGNKLVRVISAVWVKMLYNVEQNILPESLKNKEYEGDYYLIETCTSKKSEITPKVTTTVSKVDERYKTDMMLPNYKGKPLAGKQTESETVDTSDVEELRQSAIDTAKREICEELNIILTSEDFTPFMMVEWYPKNANNKMAKNLVGGYASKAQKQSISEFIKKNHESKTYDEWEKTRSPPPTKNKKELKKYFAERLKIDNSILKAKKEAEIKLKEAKEKQKAVTKIQASFRANSKRKKEAKEKAVTKIQAVQRGKKARVKAKKEKEKKKKIQSCESCSENSIKHTEVEGGKLVTWEWIKDAKNDEDSGTTLNDMPPIENARASKSYPTLPTLYQIIHLRTINLATKGWGTQWKDKKLDMETLKLLRTRTKLMEVYPPPYCTWQEKPSPFCFNVYENPANKGKCNNKILQQKNMDERRADREKQEAEEPKEENIAALDGGGKRKKRRTRKRKKKGTRKRKKKRTRKRKRKKRSKN